METKNSKGKTLKKISENKSFKRWRIKSLKIYTCIFDVKCTKISFGVKNLHKFC